MKIKLFILFVIFLALNTTIHAQKKAKITDLFLQSMQGDWKGKLTYTDYQDDSTQVTMDVWLKSSIIDNKLIKQFFYKEPDGDTKQKSKSQDTTYIIDKGYKLVESGYQSPFAIQTFTTQNGMRAKSEAPAREQAVIMETIDDDNEKKSTIRVTITTSLNSMTIKKEVKYDNTNSFFVRHTFRYTK